MSSFALRTGLVLLTCGVPLSLASELPENATFESTCVGEIADPTLLGICMGMLLEKRGMRQEKLEQIVDEFERRTPLYSVVLKERLAMEAAFLGISSRFPFTCAGEKRVFEAPQLSAMKQAIEEEGEEIPLIRSFELALDAYPEKGLIYGLQALRVLTEADIRHAQDCEGGRSAAQYLSRLAAIPGTEVDPYGGIYHFWGFFMAKLFHPSSFSTAVGEMVSAIWESKDPSDRLADSWGMTAAIALRKYLSDH